MTVLTQWSSLNGMFGTKPTWVPDEDQDRLAAYIKYDELYWNEPTQFALRVLEGEEPLYIPNARTVVDTTSHYILKGLTLGVEEKDKRLKEALTSFLRRECFYSRFQTAKLSGVARGDFVFHLTANPNKVGGTRISLNAVDPSSVFPIYDEDIPDKLVGCHIATEYYLPEEPNKTRVIRLTYRLVENGESRTVTRHEAIYEMEPKWFGPEPKMVKELKPLATLDPRITAIPVYWFKNLDWDNQLFGSSELRGFESLLRTVSQGSTDVSAALSLEGLGVYATDGGRPVTDNGDETDWEVAPGKVMEVPSGAYFRRVEGVGSVTPALDQLGYLESKLREATSLSDVALGRVDVQTAQSGIALAIKFMPTLAKVEQRDNMGIDRLTQLFYDWKTWHAVFEFEELKGDIVPEIGDKLPQNRTERVNELNNMYDRKIIPRSYYREQMAKLGYEFPANVEDLLKSEAEQDAERMKMQTASTPEDEPEGSTLEQGNQSNNRERTNESGGTEADQSIETQARGA